MGRRTPVESGSVDSCSYEFDGETVGRGEDPVERPVKLNARTTVLRTWVAAKRFGLSCNSPEMIILCPFFPEFRG